MKNNIRKIALGLCLTGALTACDLDVVPPADIAAENFWQTEKDAWYALNTCYATLDGVDIWDELCTDNAHSHKPWEGNFEMVQQNGISTANGYGSYYFGTVRIVNNFIANIDKCAVSEELKTRMKAEARFFRALSYLDLTTKFGKVPVITEVLAYDAPNVKRDEVETVRKFILDELAEIVVICMKPDVLLVPVLWPSVPVQLYISATMLKPRLQPEKSYLKDIILYSVYHRLPPHSKKKLTKWMHILTMQPKVSIKINS